MCRLVLLCPVCQGDIYLGLLFESVTILSCVFTLVAYLSIKDNLNYFLMINGYFVEIQTYYTPSPLAV
jgi:hypothetical protein